MDYSPTWVEAGRGAARALPRKGGIMRRAVRMSQVRRPSGLPAARYSALNCKGNTVNVLVVAVLGVLMVAVNLMAVLEEGENVALW